MSSSSKVYKQATPRVRAFWYTLLCLLGFASLCWPVFNRIDPQLFGFPFFIWFQTLLILISAVATGLALKAGA